MYIQVALPIPFFDPFIYSVPKHLLEHIQIGQRIVVPLRNKLKVGIVVKLNEENRSSIKNIKKITDIIDKKPLITPIQLQFAKWISQYYLCSLGEVLQNTLTNFRKPKSVDLFYVDQQSQPFQQLNESEQTQLLQSSHYTLKSIKLNQYDAFVQNGLLKALPSFQLNESKMDFQEILIIVDQTYVPKKNTKIAELFQCMKQNTDQSLAIEEVQPQHKNTLGYLKKKNIIQIQKKKIQEHEKNNGKSKVQFQANLKLNDSQENCFQTIKAECHQNKSQVFLLHGVTGSGKTELYKHLSYDMVKQQKQVLILIPEILLVGEIYNKFLESFSENIVLQFHSQLTPSVRYNSVQKIQNQQIKIIIGTRSALFLPLDNIGLIIVDEEHDQSYKQNESPFFNARDSAVYLAGILKCTILLGSATPSIESYYNTQIGKYKLLTLQNRVLNRQLPQIQCIDLKTAPICNKIFYLSHMLKTILEKNYQQKKQSLLFLNRRGFSTLLKCKICQECYYCKNCSIPMKLHKKKRMLQCHHCDEREQIVSKCKCGGQYKLVGFGTQMIEEDIQSIFPEAKTTRIDRDSMTHTDEFQSEIEKMKNKEIDFIIGTQMITKGFDIENIGLVAVMLADNDLYTTDFRGNERIFQILTQVSGRSGRNDQYQGHTLIQTFNPNQQAIKSAIHNDYNSFYQSEIEKRSEFNMPPFSKLVKIIINDPNEIKVKDVTMKLYESLQMQFEESTIQIFGPFEGQIYKQRNRYYWQILLKCSSWKTLNQYCYQFFWQRKTQKLLKGTRLLLNVDA